MDFIERLKNKINILIHKEPEELDYEKTLIKQYYFARILNKEIQLLIISDTHGDLARNTDLQKSIINKKYDLCCILGDLHDYDYKIILKYVPKEKIVGLLGNHDRFDLLNKYGISNISGKVINIKGKR